MKLLIFILSFISINWCFCQDPLSIKEINSDSLILNTSTINWNNYIYTSYLDYTISHNPTEEDEKIYRKYKGLHWENTTQKNHENFYKLACSSWNLGKLDEAEKLFLTIIQSNQSFYTETTKNGSGYGSYSSNYKNSSCQYLCEINIEKKNFEKALEYYSSIIEKYPIYYSCGTGNYFYQGHLDKLKTLCLEGLGEYNLIIDLFLKDYGDAYCANLVNAIKKTYTQEQINIELTNIENTFSLVLDSFPSQTISYENYGEKNQIELVSEYTSGEAKITLFGRELTLERPIMEHGEKVCKDDFLNMFMESPFYKNLIISM